MKFTEDPTFEQQIKKQSPMRVLLMAKAKQVINLAGGLAAQDTGYYERTLDTEWDATRARAVAVSRDMYGGRVIEFGGPNNAAQAPLRRAADVVCDGFKRTPKPGKP